MRSAAAGLAPDLDKAMLPWQMTVHKGRERMTLREGFSFVATVDNTVADAQCIFLNYVLKV